MAAHEPPPLRQLRLCDDFILQLSGSVAGGTSYQERSSDHEGVVIHEEARTQRGTEEEARYQIVGEHEADVKGGKISVASPIARAMISKEIGDVVEVNTPGGVKAYEILKVEWK